MTKAFHFTREAIFDGYTLRDDREYARAIITRDKYGRFHYRLLQNNIEAGPFKSLRGAARSLRVMFRKHNPALAPIKFASRMGTS